MWLNVNRVELRRAAGVMGGISAFINGAPLHLFKALAESDEEGEALYGVSQSRQSAASGSAEYNEMELGEMMG